MTRYLIAIGSSQCPKMNGFSKLKRIGSDIDKVTKLLTEQGYIRVISDQIDLDELSQNIKNAVSNWFNSSERQRSDCVIVYYGGHGNDAGNPQYHYLFTFESQNNRIDTTAIKTRDFVASFFGNQNSPQNVLLILDTCYAQAGGRQISQVVSELKDVTPEGSGFWVICSSDANTEAGDGAFVEALCAVMNPDGEEFQQDGEFIPIETLVSRINQHFETTRQPQRASADGRNIQRETTFFQNPKYNPNNPNKPNNSNEPKKSVQLANHLCSLDYIEQTRIVEDYVRGLQKVGAFVVQAKDRPIQNWLVKRLFNQLPNVGNAEVFEFGISAHHMWQYRDFNKLWSDFASRLNCEADSTTIIKKIMEIYQTIPVIIAMYDWPDSQRSQQLSQQLQEQVLTEFWQPLVNEVRNLPNQPQRSRLVLFLAKHAIFNSLQYVLGL